MVGQLLAMWAMSVLAPLGTLLFVMWRMNLNDANVKSMFDALQEELAKCRERERRLSERIDALERLQMK